MHPAAEHDEISTAFVAGSVFWMLDRKSFAACHLDNEGLERARGCEGTKLLACCHYLSPRRSIPELEAKRQKRLFHRDLGMNSADVEACLGCSSFGEVVELLLDDTTVLEGRGCALQ